MLRPERGNQGVNSRGRFVEGRSGSPKGVRAKAPAQGLQIPFRPWIIELHTSEIPLSLWRSSRTLLACDDNGKLCGTEQNFLMLIERAFQKKDSCTVLAWRRVRLPYATRLGHFAFWPLPSRGRMISVFSSFYDLAKSILLNLELLFHKDPIILNTLSFQPASKRCAQLQSML
jgi:hypothetical protein